MHYKNSIFVMFFFVCSSLCFAMAGDQSATCTMDDKQHKAHYDCPDHYEVIYSGDGEKVCNGACYEKGNKQSLREAIARLLELNDMKSDAVPYVATTDTAIGSAVKELLSGKEVVTLSYAGRKVTLHAPNQQAKK